MVKIPALELDGQNWKNYRAKLLEHAATKGWLDVLAGASDDGTYDWEGYNALLHELLHDTVPISIYIRLRRNTAHQVFKYLAKRFRDREPIADPRAKKLATCANEDKHYPSAESPTSENAATERLANAKRDEEDLPCTKDLTRGNEDVNDRNVGREDPCTSLEASAKGNSAESAGTTVLLESAPHETQTEPQDSLPLTPRPPIDGEPRECKQEVVESVVTAERTKGTAQSANPPETDADVNRKATLGREPAETVCRVNKGDKERDNESRLQQTNFYCKEDRQHDENVNADVPSAHRLPLEGEWTVRASGGLTNSSEGCERGAVEQECVDEPIVECCQQLCMADGDPGRGVEPTDTPNESRTLVTRSIESESPDNGSIPRVHLGSMSRHAGDANGAGRGADRSKGQTDESKGLTDVSRGRADESKGSMDALNASNGAVTDGMSWDEGAGTYLGAGGANHVVNAMDGVRSWTDASTGPTDIPSVDTETPAIAPEDVSIPQNEQELLNLPMETARWTPDAPNGVGDHTDGSSRRTDTHSIGNGRETAENDSRSVRKRQTEAQTRNSPKAHEIATPEPTKRWRKVSAGGIHVYIPWNAPVAAIETANRNIVFGRPDSGDEAIAPSVEGERAGEGDGGGYGGDGDVGDTTSGGNSDSIRVEAALLAGESQRVRYSRRT